eukprot:jgi/Orpsp1_1/1174311/evm.model.c7180000049633.1
MKYYSIILFFSIILFNTFKCNAFTTYEETKYYLQNVEGFTVENNTYYCPPEESSLDRVVSLTNRNGEKFTACEYQYFCHEDEPCLKVHSANNINNFPTDRVNLNYGEYLVDINDNNKKKILVSCSNVRLKKDRCITETCNSNSDCFSENCVKGVLNI